MRSPNDVQTAWICRTCGVQAEPSAAPRRRVERLRFDDLYGVHISLTERVEYLDENDSVISYSDSGTARDAYIAHCATLGIEPDRRILGSA